MSKLTFVHALIATLTRCPKYRALRSRKLSTTGGTKGYQETFVLQKLHLYGAIHSKNWGVGHMPPSPLIPLPMGHPIGIANGCPI